MARTARTKQLTALHVKRYVENPQARAPLHDGGGLYLRKREAANYWYLRMTDPATGKEQWQRMFAQDAEGTYPHKSLSAARVEAERLWAMRGRGLDPRAEHRRAIAERKAKDDAALQQAARRVSVKALFDRWVEIDLKPHVRADGTRTGRKDGGKFIQDQFERRVFPALGEVVAAEVQKTDLLAILDGVKAEGKLRTANVLLANLKQMFRFALVREIVERNPLDTITKRDAGGAEVGRDRVLSANEIQELAQALPGAGLNERSRAAIWITLGTACRVGELMNARWEDVNLDTGRWYLPDTKNGRDHTIHLSAFALRYFAALADRKELDDHGETLPWVLPNSKGTGPVDIKSFGKQLSDRQRPPERRLNGRSKATWSLRLSGGAWTAHDLRRTAATLMARLGVSGDVIDECLNHVIESRVRRTYIRDRRPEAQALAFDALGKHLLTQVEASRHTTPAETPHTLPDRRQAPIASRPVDRA